MVRLVSIFCQWHSVLSECKISIDGFLNSSSFISSTISDLIIEVFDPIRSSLDGKDDFVVSDDCFSTEGRAIIDCMSSNWLF